jgi:hypothetical protein
MSNYEFIKFDVVDWKGDNTLSTYALKQTPLTFIPKLSGFSYLRTLWDYGDGTISTALTGVKSYDSPGRYVVNLTIYDCYSNAIISYDSKIVQIQDFVTHTFRVDFDDPAYYDNIIWKNGKINGPITIKTFYSPNKEESSIYYRTNSLESEYYFNDTPYKYQHLNKTYSFYEKIYNRTLNNSQYNEIDRISTDNSPLYAKIVGSDIVYCSSGERDAFFVGLSGYKQVYFKEDSIGNINIDLFFDKKDTIEDSINTLKISLSASIVENDEVDHLSITSNGLDGEYFQIDSFNIDSKKFASVEIPFVIKIKDYENFSLKNFPLISTTYVNIAVLSSGGVISPSYYDIRHVEDFHGAARGTILFKNSNKIHNIQLSASLTTTNDQNSAYTLTGVTNQFDVYPINYINIEKKNEDFDAKETFKGLRFQEFLLDKNILFDDFIGAIFGDTNSSYDTLGKKVYEKISNFVENIQDVDRNEIYSLISQMNMLGTENNVFNSNLFTYPEKIRRLLGLGSIDKNKLVGTNNKFRENFDTRGHTSKETYGINLGNQIDTDTYIISAGIPIVALEKFSNDYVLLNTEQPPESATYKLSSYSSDWGWPLVLPDTFQYSDMEKYYLFFEYNPVYDNTLSDYSIVYNTSLYSTISSENVILDENNEIMLTESGHPLLSEFNFDYVDEILNLSLRDTLYQSLSLTRPL